MTASVRQASRVPQVVDPAPPRLSLHLLNGFDLRLDRTHVQISSRSQRVIAVLAVTASPLSRTVVAGMLWPETSTTRALASVRSALWTLPRLVQPIIRADGPSLQIADGVSVDLRDASRLAARVVHASLPEVDEIDTTLLSADFLPTWSEDWIIVEQERFRQARLHALEALCVAFAERGRYARAVEVGMLAVSADPLRETAHRALMGAHLAECNYVEAVRQYRLYARLLKDELDLAPSPRMTAMLDFVPVTTAITSP